MVRRKCAVCGRKYAKLIRLTEHGDGYLDAEVISLCGGHEAELRESGRADFFAKYHLDGGIECDKTILKIYGLRR